MRALGYAALAAAALVSLVFVNALMPSTPSVAVLIGSWLLLPYVLLALALRFMAKTPAALRMYTAMTVATTLGGLLFLTYVIYLRPDPQGGIAVMFTPLYQLAGIVALFPICEWLFGKRRAS